MRQKKPLFTSFAEKRDWLRKEQASWQRIVDAQLKRQNWRMADEAFAHLCDVEVELDLVDTLEREFNNLFR